MMISNWKNPLASMIFIKTFNAFRVKIKSSKDTPGSDNSKPCHDGPIPKTDILRVIVKVTVK